MYNGDHKMHNYKYKSPIEEKPQKEVLQPCIKTEKSLTALFYWLQTIFDYTSDLEKTNA